MQWRNEQIYHLRQSKPLTLKNQEYYFKNNVALLFKEDKPNQILFSFLKDNKCIGYGGLVHINWIDKNAEISFIMDTKLEDKYFNLHWKTYLSLIERVAFSDLQFHKIFTYAFDIRKHLYPVLEDSGFKKEAVLKEHCYFDGEFKDVIIHTKINNQIKIRKLKKSDEKLIFDWANDPVTRKNSYQDEPITYETHKNWFQNKIKNKEAYYYICEINKTPAGLVRFDKNEKEVVIGITIDEKFRGKKLALTFLRKACGVYLNENTGKIVAYIKRDNIASIKSFEKAGFKFFEELEINKVPSYKFYYEK